jgi:hypothetical protein
LVKVRTVVLLGLAAVMVMSVGLAAGCGGSSLDKARLTAALTDFELSAGSVTQALAAGSDATVAASIKAAKADMKVKWQAVLAAAGSDWKSRDQAEKAWADAENAIDSLPDNATVATATAALTPAMDSLMALEGELWNLAQTAK